MLSPVSQGTKNGSMKALFTANVLSHTESLWQGLSVSCGVRVCFLRERLRNASRRGQVLRKDHLDS